MSRFGNHKPPTFSDGNFEIDWLSTSIIALPPVLVTIAALAGLAFQWKTFVVALMFYALIGIGVTAGYHRLFSHASFVAHPALAWFLALAGAGAFEGSIKWWCRNHRIHHRYVDTSKDPYDATRGFFFSHVGWMLMKQDPKALGRVDVEDLKADPLVMFQHNNYLLLALSVGVFLPTLICGLGWGDWYGGYFYAALARMVFVHHTTFFINSIAHMNLFGATQNFSDQHTSHDSWVCALLTLGEGYHNYHHEFAKDYRNGIRWYQWDPTKWFIRTMSFLGLASNLVRVPNDVIRRNIYNMKWKHCQDEEKHLQPIVDTLRQRAIPSVELTMEEVKARVAKGQKLIIVDGYVVDVEKIIGTGAGYTHENKELVWYNEHPGGRQFLDAYVGEDATSAMKGEVYKHHEAAMNMVVQLRVAVLKK